MPSNQVSICQKNQWGRSIEAPKAPRGWSVRRGQCIQCGSGSCSRGVEPPDPPPGKSTTASNTGEGKEGKGRDGKGGHMEGRERSMGMGWAGNASYPYHNNSWKLEPPLKDAKVMNKWKYLNLSFSFKSQYQKLTHHSCKIIQGEEPFQQVGGTVGVEV